MLRLLRVVGAVGAITRLFSLAFLLPVLIALAYDPYDTAVGPYTLPRNVLVFFFGFCGTYLLGGTLRIIAADANEEDLQDREAYLTVGIGWLLLCALAALPFMLDGTLVHPADAYFEAMSGLTTTGATVIPDLDAVAPSMHMWRGAIQFIGGMGIIVLSVAVLARLTQGGMQMIQAEAPGPSVSRIAPRLAQTARILWTVYLILAAVLFVILLVLFARHGMGLKQAFFDAMMHTFTTMSTGGFSNRATSIAYYDDWVIELVLSVFMVLAGTNFTLHYFWMHGRPGGMFKDPEFRFYIAGFFTVILLTTGILARSGYGALQGLRDSLFTTASLITSTGFGTADFDQWPAVAKFLILLVMVTGASAGSTAGGVKQVRVLLLFQVVRRELTRIRHPGAVVPIRLGGRSIKPETVMATVGFFFAFVAIWIGGTVLLVAFDPHMSNIVDAASASISALSNMGPGLGVVGPTQSYAGLTVMSKIILILEMWFGRLEIFTALLMLTPGTWRH